MAKAIAQTKEVYSFPILEAEEIVEVLREMGAAVGEEDINKPNSHSFRQWCELFIIEILEINKDELYQANFEFAEALDGSEDLHEASVPVVHFIRCMCVTGPCLPLVQSGEGFLLIGGGGWASAGPRKSHPKGTFSPQPPFPQFPLI